MKAILLLLLMVPVAYGNELDQILMNGTYEELEQYRAEQSKIMPSIQSQEDLELARKMMQIHKDLMEEKAMCSMMQNHTCQ